MTGSRQRRGDTATCRSGRTYFWISFAAESCDSCPPLKSRVYLPEADFDARPDDKFLAIVGLLLALFPWRAARAFFFSPDPRIHPKGPYGQPGSRLILGAIFSRSRAPAYASRHALQASSRPCAGLNSQQPAGPLVNLCAIKFFEGEATAMSCAQVLRLWASAAEVE